MRIWLPSNPTYRGALIGLACAALCWGLNSTALVRSLENRSLDLCFATRGTRPSQHSVVIVEIDSRTLGSIMKPFIYFSPEMGQVIRLLAAQNVKSVGLDFMVDNRLSKIFDSEQAARLGNLDGMTEGLAFAWEKNIPVVLPAVYDPGAAPGSFGRRRMEPIHAWLPFDFERQDVDRGSLAFINVAPDDDQVMRRQALAATVAEPDSESAVSFALAASAEPCEIVGHKVRLAGGETVPTQQGQMLINYVGPMGAIPTVSFLDLLLAANPGYPAENPDVYAGPPDLKPSPFRLGDADLKDKVILIGVTAESIPDWKATPYTNSSFGKFFMRQDNYDRMPGVEVHANTIATLQDRAFITTPFWLSTPFLLLVFGTSLGAVLTRVSLQRGAAITFAHHWLWKGFSIGLFAMANYRVEMVSMLILGTVVYGAVFAFRWRWIRRTMGLVKSEAVARTLEANPRTLHQLAEEREITVLFSDIRDFCTFSERSTAPEVVRLLNAYFSVVIPEIEKEGGIVTQYMGDGIMVMFNAPEPLPGHAAHAVRAANACLAGVKKNRGRWQELGFPNMKIGIGIHTGVAVVGTIGSANRLDFTANGDVVNTASRIESANKREDLKTEVLISGQTLSQLGQQEIDEFRISRDYKQIDVKGRQSKVNVHWFQTDHAASQAAKPRSNS